MRKLFKLFLVLWLVFPGTVAFADTTVIGGGSGGVLTSSDCDTSAYYAIGTLCQDTDDGKLYKGTGAAVEEIATGTTMATDTLWDAAGDLAYGTGANTAGRLAAGTGNQILMMNAGATAPAWTSTLGLTGTRLTKGWFTEIETSNPLKSGVAGATAGGLVLSNATSGTISLNPATGALGTIAITVPATTGTMAVLASGSCSAAGCTGFDGTDKFTYFGANSEDFYIRAGSAANVNNIGSSTAALLTFDQSVSIGPAAPDDVQPTFAIRGDADSDAGGDTTEALTFTLTPNADPTLATWGITSTQSAGYKFDKPVQAPAKFVSFAGEATLTAAAHNGAMVMMTTADEVTMWDCTSSTIGHFVTLWARDAEKIEVVPASGDQFYLFNGTGIGANDELDIAATAGTKVTLMCTAANEWRVVFETAACTDGGAAD